MSGFAFGRRPQRLHIRIDEHRIERTGQIGEITRRRVRGNHRFLATCEQRKERAREIKRIVDAQRVALRRLRTQRECKRLHARTERGEIEQ